MSLTASLVNRQGAPTAGKQYTFTVKSSAGGSDTGKTLYGVVVAGGTVVSVQQVTANQQQTITVSLPRNTGGSGLSFILVAATSKSQAKTEGRKKANVIAGYTITLAHEIGYPTAKPGTNAHCTYKGNLRSDYVYTGTNINQFTNWQHCKLTTTNFEAATSKGNGMSAVHYQPSGGGKSPGPSPSPSPGGPGTIFGVSPVVWLALGGGALSVLLKLAGVF